MAAITTCRHRVIESHTFRCFIRRRLLLLHYPHLIIQTHSIFLLLKLHPVPAVWSSLKHVMSWFCSGVAKIRCSFPTATLFLSLWVVFVAWESDMPAAKPAPQCRQWPTASSWWCHLLCKAHMPLQCRVSRTTDIENVFTPGQTN